MTFFLYLLVIMIWGCLVFAATSFYTYSKELEEVRANLDNFIPPWKVMRRKTNSRALIHKWMDDLAPTGKKIQILSDQDEMEDVLVKAGHPFQLSVHRLHGAKLLGLFAGVFLAVLFNVVGLPLAQLSFVLLPIVGYLSPILLVRYLAKKRQEQVRLELPDFLDMMSITLQAGMAMDDAMAYYAEATRGPLGEELNRMLQEIKFGVQRETAYRGLIKRTESPELEALIMSLIQAHNLGTPIAQTFTQQAVEMRRMRSEKAKEAAGKASPKISLVSGLVIAPSIMLLMLGAILYNVVFKNLADLF
ncbi:type II secretion system F family protein [Laceyella putida]|uniref:Type II secretion system F family protein n=1 Tax=Laceyella putida TaxID=110101 RepID=A0ABW2RQU1_9BACL